MSLLTTFTSIIYHRFTIPRMDKSALHSFYHPYTMNMRCLPVTADCPDATPAPNAVQNDVHEHTETDPVAVTSSRHAPGSRSVLHGAYTRYQSITVMYCALL